MDTETSRGTYIPLDVMLWISVLVLEVTVVLGYVTVTGARLSSYNELIYSWIWINAGLYAVVNINKPSGSTRKKAAVGLLASLYFVVLMWLSGFLGLASSEAGLHVTWVVPAWGPILTFADVIYIKILPFMAIGFLALSYLVYAAVLDASRSMAAGALGLVSCVGCTWPVFSALLGAFAGGTGGITTAVYSIPYGLSTVVFVASVAVLYYRPLR